jgi:hypothetical protein
MTWRTPALLIVVTVLISGVNLTRDRDREENILGEMVITETISPTAVPTSTPLPTPTLKPKPTIKPTPTSKPQPKFTSEQIYGFTERFGGQYGVDPNVLRHVALCESTFKPEARNYIYAGLYQFDTRTWKVYRQKMGEDPDPDLRYNAEEAVQTAAYAISLGQLRLWPNCQP